MIRFRLLECPVCKRRTWITATEETPEHDCRSFWVERFSFVAESQGPGLHPVQVTR